MNRSLFVKYILPFIEWYALLIFTALFIDYFLHRYQLIAVGRYLGSIGSLSIVISFVYSLRKRSIIKTGSPKSLLVLHEYLAWIGSIMILVHAGIHFNAILPWLAILMMLVAVASGLIGKFLLKKANDSLNERKQRMLKEGLSIEEVERKLFFDSITVDLMKKWRKVHLPITMVLGILVLLHVLTIIMFSA